jgi:hypothetical protein
MMIWSKCSPNFLTAWMISCLSTPVVMILSALGVL